MDIPYSQKIAIFSYQFTEIHTIFRRHCSQSCLVFCVLRVCVFLFLCHEHISARTYFVHSNNCAVTSSAELSLLLTSMLSIAAVQTYIQIKHKTCVYSAALPTKVYCCEIFVEKCNFLCVCIFASRNKSR